MNLFDKITVNAAGAGRDTICSRSESLSDSLSDPPVAKKRDILLTFSFHKSMKQNANKLFIDPDIFHYLELF